MKVPTQPTKEKPQQGTESSSVNFNRLAFLIIALVLACAILEPLLRQYTLWITGTFLLLLAVLVFGLIKYPSFRQGLFSALKSIFTKFWAWITNRHEKQAENQVIDAGSNKRTPIPIDVQRQVIGRAKSRCQWEWCKRHGSLEIHHIDGKPSNHRLNNLIYLCPNHHQDAHDRRARTWQIHDWAKGKYQPDIGDL